MWVHTHAYKFFKIYFDTDVSSYMWGHFLNQSAHLLNCPHPTVGNGLLLCKPFQFTDSWLCMLHPQPKPKILILPVNHLLGDLWKITEHLCITWKDISSLTSNDPAIYQWTILQVLTISEPQLNVDKGTIKLNQDAIRLRCSNAVVTCTSKPKPNPVTASRL